MIYPKELSNILLKKSYAFIPKKLAYYEQLKVFHKYWSDESKSFYKVENTFFADNIQYYSIKYIITSLYGVISEPINSNTYELVADRNDITHLESIINTEQPYYGSEIKYWFFIHQDDTNYNYLKSYIDLDGQSLISDNKLYFLKAEINPQGKFYNYKFEVANKKIYQ